MNYSNRTKKALWSAVMAVGVGGLATQVMGQTTNQNYALNATDAAQVDETTTYGGANYIDMEGSGRTGPSFGVIQYDTGGPASPTSIPSPVVTAVSPNFTVSLYDEGYSGEFAGPDTFNFYLTTDNTTSIDYPATTLRYETTGTVSPGLAAPGATGGFAGGSNLYYLGSGSFTGYPGNNEAATEENFPLSLSNAGSPANVSAAENYLLSQVQSGGNLRIVVTTNATTDYQSIDGYASGEGPAPAINLNVTSATATPNNSTIALTTVPPGNGNTAHNATVVLQQPRVIESYADTQTFSVSATGSAGTSALILAEPEPGNGLDGSAPPSGSANPIPAGSTGTVTVGLNTTDTSGYTAGYTASGTVTFVDGNDTSSTITITASAVVVDQRKITAGGTGFNQAAAINAGKILVGTTATVPNITLSTTNTDSNLPVGNDEGPDVLTTETLAAGAQSAAYTYKDPFTTASVATLSATAGPSFTFNSATPDTNGVTASVAVAVSGIYGDAHSTTINGQTEHFNGQYTGFSDTAGLSNDGTTAGEYDTADVYLQWQGYQAASVTGNTGSTLTPGNAATLSNAASNDNIYMGVNNGLRASAWVTGIAYNQTWSGGGGWSEAGLNASTSTSTLGSGTVVTAGGASAQGTIGFTATNQMINGTYGATMTVDLENQEDIGIQGVAANDVAPVVFTLQTTVSDFAGTGTGTYTLRGGTLVAGATDLTGSFTQSGGQSTFTNITGGTGQVTISGGSATLAVGGGGSSVSSLSISGTGSLDITNNHIFIDYGSGADPVSAIRNYLINGYSGGAWNGVGGIISSTAALPANSAYSLGYADSADPGNPAGLATHQIEIKYTLLGDATLTGTVTGTDFTILATNLGKSVSGWDQGDFLYTGTVTGSDFTALVTNLGKTASGADLALPAADWAAVDAFAAANGLMADVPEPATTSLLALGAIGMLARRRRQSS